MARICLDLEIGATIADLSNLMQRGLPDPDEWTFRPYSSTRVGGDGRSRGFGFPTASWRWNSLSQQMLDVFLSFFAADTDASVPLVIWTYRDSGAGLSTMRARYDAIMHRPVDGEGKSIVNESRLPMYTDVTISFTRLESV